jgi:hypothetical protein
MRFRAFCSKGGERVTSNAMNEVLKKAKALLLPSRMPCVKHNFGAVSFRKWKLRTIASYVIVLQF